MTKLTHKSRTTHIALLLAGASALAAMGGCSWFGGGSDGPSRPDVTTSRPTMARGGYTSEQPLPSVLQPRDRPLISGPLPLVAILEESAPHRVVFVPTGEEVAAFDGVSGQIVRVEARGVLLANKVIMGATLTPGVYAVEVVNPSGSGTLVTSQTRTVPIARPPQPASRPAPRSGAAALPATQSTPPPRTPQ